MENPIHCPVDGRVTEIFVDAGDVVQNGDAPGGGMKFFEEVLVANRGEIAIRVMRACRELGVETVAIYSDADTNPSTRKYTEMRVFHVGEGSPSRNYLNIDRILEVAKKSGAEAVHPGYGFLAENYRFARRGQEDGVTFIGPSWQTIEMMGSKIGLKKTMRDVGVPVVPGGLKAASGMSKKPGRFHRRLGTRSS